MTSPTRNGRSNSHQRFLIRTVDLSQIDIVLRASVGSVDLVLKVKLSDGGYMDNVLIPFNKDIKNVSEIREIAVSMHHEAFGKLKGIDNKLIYYSDAIRMIVIHTGGTKVWVALLVCIIGVVVCLINL